MFKKAMKNSHLSYIINLFFKVNNYKAKFSNKFDVLIFKAKTQAKKMPTFDANLHF